MGQRNYAGGLEMNGIQLMLIEFLRPPCPIFFAVIFYLLNQYPGGLTFPIQEAIPPDDPNCHLHP
jgi:hypothetical protein